MKSSSKSKTQKNYLKIHARKITEFLERRDGKNTWFPERKIEAMKNNRKKRRKNVRGLEEKNVTIWCGMNRIIDHCKLTLHPTYSSLHPLPHFPALTLNLTPAQAPRLYYYTPFVPCDRPHPTFVWGLCQLTPQTVCIHSPTWCSGYGRPLPLFGHWCRFAWQARIVVRGRVLGWLSVLFGWTPSMGAPCVVVYAYYGWQMNTNVDNCDY